MQPHFVICPRSLEDLRRQRTLDAFPLEVFYGLSMGVFELRDYARTPTNTLSLLYQTGLRRVINVERCKTPGYLTFSFSFFIFWHYPRCLCGHVDLVVLDSDVWVSSSEH